MEWRLMRVNLASLIDKGDGERPWLSDGHPKSPGLWRDAFRRPCRVNGVRISGFDGVLQGMSVLAIQVPPPLPVPVHSSGLTRTPEAHWPWNCSRCGSRGAAKARAVDGGKSWIPVQKRPEAISCCSKHWQLNGMNLIAAVARSLSQMCRSAK